MIMTAFQEKDQMMTFYIQKAKGQLHCDVTMRHKERPDPLFSAIPQERQPERCVAVHNREVQLWLKWSVRGSETWADP